jgi:uncharacterized protein YqgV (UPF0045/DUF77 family)
VIGAAVPDLTAEFTIEPFDEGRPGPHVVKAIEAVEASGAEVSVGPFGTKVEGNRDEIVRAVGAALDASLSEGASHVTVTVINPAAVDDSAFTHPVFAALRQVLDVVGADPIAPELLVRTDVPIEWEGEVIGGIRLRSLEGAVSRMVGQIAGEIGGDLSTLSREQKQQVVRMLNERGAFLIRGAVEEVADLMGVSRITIYNYLNATRREPVTSVAD